MKWQQLYASLKGFFYKAKYEYILGKAVIKLPFYAKCKFDIKGPGKIIIGKNCIIDKTVFHQDYVTLYTHNSNALINIGNNVILRGTRLGCHKNIVIKDFSVIECASIFDSDFHNIDANKRDFDFQENNKSVTIHEKSYIGMEALIGKGTEIGENSIVFPATVVSNKKIPSNSSVMGLPAKIQLNSNNNN